MKGLSNLKSIDKNTFELLDNLLKFSLDDIYITRDDFFINDPEYCISNYNGNDDDGDDHSSGLDYDMKSGDLRMQDRITKTSIAASGTQTPAVVPFQLKTMSLVKFLFNKFSSISFP